MAKLVEFMAYYVLAYVGLSVAVAGLQQETNFWLIGAGLTGGLTFLAYALQLGEADK